LAKHDYEEFRKFYNNIRSFKDNIDFQRDTLNTEIVKIDNTVHDKVKNLSKKAEKTDDVEHFAETLIEIQSLQDNIPEFRTTIC
jgi:hypothetical protein